MSRRVIEAMREGKWSVAPMLLLLVCATQACAVADIRPEPLEASVELAPAEVERGRALLEQLPQTHGGGQAWRAHQNARLTFTDTWPGWAGRNFVMPWDENGQRMVSTIELGQDNSRLELPDGTIWGIQNWVTYEVDEGGVSFAQNKNAWFWLPTIEYFFEAPFRLREGQHVAWAGERELDGKTYDLIYITWGSVAPSAEIDQYVAWIERGTGRLGLLEYTVRDMFKFVTGTAKYKDYATIEGILVPQTIEILSGGPDGQILHVMAFDKIDFGVEVPVGYFVPDRMRSAPKQNKGKHGE